MAIYGIGTDLELIERVARLLQNPAFLVRFFGENERKRFADGKNPPSSVCAAFCAKEAYGKALGIGLSFPWREVELLHGKNGKPFLKLSGGQKENAKSLKLTFHVSVSHTHRHALATVVAEQGVE